MRVPILLIVALSTAFPVTARAQWIGSADFLLMRRSDNSSTVFQQSITRTFTSEILNETTTITDGFGNVTETVTPVTLIETEEFTVGPNALDSGSVSQDFVGGGRVSLGYRFEGLLVGGSFLVSESAESAAAVDSLLGRLASPLLPAGTVTERTVSSQDIRGPGPFPAPTVTTTTAGTDQLSTHAAVFYESELTTGDLYAAMDVYSGRRGNIAILGGARYLNINEAFQISSRNDLAARADETTNTVVENRMIGPQMGLQVRAPLGGFGIFRFDYKSAFMFNDLEKTVSIDGGATASASVSDSSFVNELNFQAELRITRHLAAHFGVQLLAVSDLALASDNFHPRFDGIDATEVQPLDDANVLYSSPYFGISLTL